MTDINERTAVRGGGDLGQKNPASIRLSRGWRSKARRDQEGQGDEGSREHLNSQPSL